MKFQIEIDCAEKLEQTVRENVEYFCLSLPNRVSVSNVVMKEMKSAKSKTQSAAKRGRAQDGS